MSETEFLTADELAEVTGYKHVASQREWLDKNGWHNYAAKATEVRFPKGRVKFAGATASAPFPVAVVVFRPKL